MRPRVHPAVLQQVTDGSLGPIGVESVAAGGMHSLFLDSNGKVRVFSASLFIDSYLVQIWSFGSNDSLALGRLTKPPQGTPDNLPALVSGLEDFRATAIAASDNLSVAISSLILSRCCCLLTPISVVRRPPRLQGSQGQTANAHTTGCIQQGKAHKPRRLRRRTRARTHHRRARLRVGQRRVLPNSAAASLSTARSTASRPKRSPSYGASSTSLRACIRRLRSTRRGGCLAGG